MFYHQQSLVHLVRHHWDVFILRVCGVTIKQAEPPDKCKECKRKVRRQMLESDVVAVPS